MKMLNLQKDCKKYRISVKKKLSEAFYTESKLYVFQMFYLNKSGYFDIYTYITLSCKIVDSGWLRYIR